VDVPIIPRYSSTKRDIEHALKNSPLLGRSNSQRKQNGPASLVYGLSGMIMKVEGLKGNLSKCKQPLYCVTHIPYNVQLVWIAWCVLVPLKLLYRHLKIQCSSKRFQATIYQNLKFSLCCYSLTMVASPVAILCHNNKLTSEMCLFGFRQVCVGSRHL